MPPSALRIGLIGAGRMGTAHAGFIAREEETVLVGVADPFSSALAEAEGVPHFADHNALLDPDGATGLDAVIVANPNGAHVATALDCIAAGVPTLLEKPVAVDHAEAARLIAAEAASNVPVLVGHHRRHHPAATAARELISAGAIGRLVGVSGIWTTRKDDTYFDAAWRRKKGAGVMLINLVHDLDLMRHLCGEIVAVQAATSNAVRGHAVEDTASVVLTFADGALGSLLVSDAVVAPWGWDQATEDDPTYPYRPDTSCYSIAGTTGSLAFPQLAHYFHDGGAAGDWMRPLSLRYEPKGAGDSYTNQLRHFVRVARGECAPLVSIADAARTLAVVEAAGRAAASGRTEPVPA
ncbi:Gfo/Idh/MocA family protein [Streptomyces longispororuber]|uniref:Gfo/Idh/MocA family protein n=1 Tax=Streptomyces longispororuber TaxID=68230 RepID=UPI00210CD13D|nr:Gfo/Idh/MocA family oxidoreductase [Streptomyces longispororuber]MCQ4209417.1 Gfo/Idh/MocA family oxidoreductase [Streptomyces longispororuber]